MECRARSAADGALQEALQSVRAILGDSAAGCKRWTAAAGATPGGEAEGGSDVQGSVSHAEGGQAAHATRKAGDGRHEWWSWRMELDERLGTAVHRVHQLCKPPLQHCLPQGSLQPVEILLGWDLHCFPWEAVQPFEKRAVFRSLPGASLRGRDVRAGVLGRCSVDVERALYVVDPEGDLPSTRERFQPWFQSIAGWDGTCGAPAMDQGQLHDRMSGRDLFIFLGHGAGALSPARATGQQVPCPSTTLPSTAPACGNLLLLNLVEGRRRVETQRRRVETQPYVMWLWHRRSQGQLELLADTCSCGALDGMLISQPWEPHWQRSRGRRADGCIRCRWQPLRGSKPVGCHRPRH